MGRRGSRLGRRQLVQGVGVAGLTLLAGCGRLPWQAEQPAKVYRIGYLSVSIGPPEWAAAFWRGLHELGYVEGQNLTTEYREWQARERLPELAADLIGRRVDVIVATGTPAIQAAKSATSTIPIVMAFSGDPVAVGLVASLPRPGGNVTGVTTLGPGLGPKRLQLLKEAVPSISRVAVFWNPSVPDKVLDFRDTQAAAQVLGLELQPLEVRAPDELERAFEAAIRWRADAVITLLDFATDPYDHALRIAEFAAKNGLPSMCELPGFPALGGLMSYGARILDTYRRAAYYVDRILKGAQPADLPVEQPREFDFVINLRTAQALGLTIPPHVRAQATEILH